eukprot:s49_g11.t1
MDVIYLPLLSLEAVVHPESWDVCRAALEALLILRGDIGGNCLQDDGRWIQAQDFLDAATVKKGEVGVASAFGHSALPRFRFDVASQWQEKGAESTARIC